ncbi:Glycosyltransferase involved in cell wall bisynthesis [Chryseobacterium wanjuense]|uniref:Glycosyltransferase involved in cell wall bisynthesis n=1 Tax=Chryseobacterium wanjuense TaxID=356305 RepID=A0A1I0N0U4_9FLAO|nr:glycosyltransferase family 4 protein [Chryseobacterium wanjuense]SEV94642.1 Glycosyltransferase involved in cell wall bisynthesis [Chryseobacterium wanjuense]
MNVLFLTLVKIDTLQQRGIYHDLMREFSAHGHNLYIVSPLERRENKKTCIKTDGNTKFLNVKTLNILKTNFIEKGISTLSIEKLFLRAIKKYFSDVKFDLVIYSTPPITFTNLIKFIKKRDNAKTYLLLKDIFPQNAVDMQFMSEKGFFYKYFRNKEKELYNISDKIGCMSKANVDFVLRHNSYIPKEKVEINPNSIQIQGFEEISQEDKNQIKSKYNIPTDKKIFIYGGNLGKPQGIDFLIKTLDAEKENKKGFFVIVGAGTEYEKIKDWIDKANPKNVLLISFLPKNDYDLLVRVCDVGLIFLHKDFTIPNYPSRLLSYLEYKIPVIAATDKNTDIGEDIVNNNCGAAVCSDDIESMMKTVNLFAEMDKAEFEKMRQNSWDFLEREFQAYMSYEKIMKSLN